MNSLASAHEPDETPPVVVIDYGLGNVAAILNMFEYLGIEAIATDSAEVIQRAHKLLLPGVGAFDKAMSLLQAKDLIKPLTTAVMESRIPVLGICLGMQLLAKRSDEGIQAGLGWIDAEVLRIRLPEASPLKVPNMGWHEVRRAGCCPLFFEQQEKERFYFDHSYHFVCAQANCVVATFDYPTPLCCAVQQNNIFGVQFHPEKSHRFGIQLLGRFASLGSEGRS